MEEFNNEIDNIALFDLDGTLCDYSGKMQDCLDSIKSPNEPDFTLDWNDDVPEYIKERMRLIKNQPGWWEKLPHFRLGMDVFITARTMGFKIKILTKGPVNTDMAWTEKARWCKTWLDPNLLEIRLTITQNKDIVYGKVLVDDYPGYIEPWLKWRKNGLVIMPAHDYNKDFRHPNVVRYTGDNLDSVKEALQIAFDRKGGEPLDLS